MLTPCKLVLLQEGFAFAHCTTCKAPYYLRVHSAGDRKWRTLKFRFFVTRDILSIFLAVQLVSIHFSSVLLFLTVLFLSFGNVSNSCFLNGSSSHR